MKTKPNKDELSELLGTAERKEQVARVRRLLLAPVVELTIRLDARTNQVSYSVMGGDLPPAVAYEMLDITRKQIHAVELSAVAQAAKSESAFVAAAIEGFDAEAAKTAQDAPEAGEGA